MKRNMGRIDRSTRLLLAATVAVLYVTGHISGTAAIILGVLSAVFVLTGLAGLCPLYMPIKYSTAGKE